MPSNHDVTRRSFLGVVASGVALPYLTLDAAQGPAPAAPPANVEKDVVYGKGGDTDLHLDIYKPTGSANKRMATTSYPMPRSPVKNSASRNPTTMLAGRVCVNVISLGPELRTRNRIPPAQKRFPAAKTSNVRLNPSDGISQKLLPIIPATAPSVLAA